MRLREIFMHRTVIGWVIYGRRHCGKAKIFYLPQPGIEPRSLDLQANTLPRRCKSQLLPQGSRSVFIPRPSDIHPLQFKIRPRIYSEPRCYSGTFHPDARNTSCGPPQWPPNVTGCRKILTARGGNRTWAAGSKGKHSTTSL